MKALIVVLVIGAVVFWVTKPIALQFTEERDFSRRRNVWYALTLAAYLSPNFWAFALVAVPLLAWAGRKDPNPVALYLLLLHVIPSIPINIPVVGINALFPLDMSRLLSLCVLIPTAWKLRRSKSSVGIRGMTAMDVTLLAYGAIQIALFIPPDLPSHVILADSFTNVLRRAFLFFIDTYVIFFVVSRSCSSRRSILEAEAAFYLSTAIMASVATFEFSRHWLLYVDLAMRWTGDPSAGFYIFRATMLRAQASAGHPLALGYLLAIGFGFWLHLQSHMKSRRVRIIGALVIWLGLLAAYSRGPWIGAILIYFAFAALGPRPLPRLLKTASIVAAVGCTIALTPLGDKILSVLPFMGGTVDSGSATYRAQLAQRSWELIRESPYFGDQLAYTKMEYLRQGQGIIDLVNTYAEVALFYGLCGLSLFVGFILVGLYKAFRLARINLHSDPDLASLGISLVACILGTLVMISSDSFGLGLAQVYYVLGGLAGAYAHLRRSPETR